MRKLYLVVEGCIIWAAFPKRKMAVEFRQREFATDSWAGLRIVPLPVYQTLEEAPTTVGDDLQEAAAW